MFTTVSTTGSTNADMLAAARSGAHEGDWLRADTQSGGRGRMGRAWASPPGNLYATTLVTLRNDDPPAATLALVAAIALHAALIQAVPGVGFTIKWPNDILVNGAKLAGILIEREGDSVVIGYGVNLSSHPDGLSRAVTSVAALCERVIDPAAFLADLAAQFVPCLSRWRSEPLAEICADWEKRAHTKGTRLAVTTASGVMCEGGYDGLDPGGALRLRLADGQSRVIHAGDVFVV